MQGCPKAYPSYSPSPPPTSALPGLEEARLRALPYLDLSAPYTQGPGQGQPWARNMVPISLLTKPQILRNKGPRRFCPSAEAPEVILRCPPCELMWEPEFKGAKGSWVGSGVCCGASARRAELTGEKRGSVGVGGRRPHLDTGRHRVTGLTHLVSTGAGP